MGNRANCIVLQNSWGNEHPPVWFYTHWAGDSLLTNVQNAIKRQERWDDQSYLARIIFDSITAGQQGGETGYGITTVETDNEHDFVVVDPEQQQVRIEDCKSRAAKHTWSFKEFCEADVSSIDY